MSSTARACTDEAEAEAIARALELSLEVTDSKFRDVLKALQRASPILAAFVDEHCALIAPGISTEDSAQQLWARYNEAVDDLVLSLLADVGIPVEDAAAALVKAKEQSVAAADDFDSFQHLMALESFELFQDLMAHRNTELHTAARKELGAAASGDGSSAEGMGSGGGGDRRRLSEVLKFDRSLTAAEGSRPRYREKLPHTRFAIALRQASQRERAERSEIDRALGETGASTDRPGRESRRNSIADAGPGEPIS